MKRSTTFILALVLVLLAFTSCDFGGNNPGGTGGNANTEKRTYNKIIYAGEDLDLGEVWTKMKDIVGPMVTLTEYTAAEASDGEIVFGDTNRAITAKAKAALEADLEKSAEYDCGYIVFVEGNSIAVYWTHDDMADIAVAKFIDVCIDTQKLVTTDGAAAYEYYDRVSFEQEKHWLALEAVADADIVEAFKKIHNFYEPDKLIEWMANLWDPETGAFYYSISARDHEPFLPDIESTRQITQLLVTSGALASRNDFPTDMKEKIVSFALNLQSPKDGYFYHPQWPQDKNLLNTDRYGRDISSALGIISDMHIDIDGDGVEDQLYPLYCAPNGTKCALHNGKDEKCVFPIADTASYISSNMTDAVTGALATSVSAAVSRVSKSTVKAVVSSHPDYSSREAFSAWLEEYNASIKENSGKAHNLSAISGEIRAHGYADIVVAHLKRVQEEVFEEQILAGDTPTGLWQRNVDYNAVWGLLKYNSYFSNKSLNYNMDYKYIPYIIDTCIKVIELPLEQESVEANDIYNMWCAIQRILDYTEDLYGEDKVKELQARIRENAEDLIENSLEKVKPFKRSDGSFSYNKSGKSATTIYGSAIALGVIEGDVNAVSLCVQMYEAMYTCLGYKKIPLFNSESAEKFFEITDNSLPIEKDKFDPTVDFESSAMPGSVSTKNNSVNGLTEIVADPKDESNGVLHFVSGENASGGEQITVAPTLKGDNCYVFESRFLFDENTFKNSYLIQFYLGGAYLLVIGRVGDEIVISESATDTNRNYETELCRVPVGKWFTLRVEYYVNGDEMNGLDSPKTKLWLNGDLIRVSDVYFGSHEGHDPGNVFNQVKIYFLKKPETHIYLDDCYCIALNKDFDPNDKEITYN